MKIRFAKTYLAVVTLAGTLALLLTSPGAFAQIPDGIPSPQAKPVGFFESWGHFLFYVVLPVVIVVLYIIWWRRTRRKRNENEENENGRNT